MQASCRHDHNFCVICRREVGGLPDSSESAKLVTQLIIGMPFMQGMRAFNRLWKSFRSHCSMINKHTYQCKPLHQRHGGNFGLQYSNIA